MQARASALHVVSAAYNQLQAGALLAWLGWDCGQRGVDALAALLAQEGEGGGCPAAAAALAAWHGSTARPPTHPQLLAAESQLVFKAPRVAAPRSDAQGTTARVVGAGS